MQNLLLDLNTRKNTFELNAKIQNEEVVGTFVSHYPSVMDRIKIETKLARILEGVDLSNMQIDAYYAARAVCYLDVVLESKPLWFDVNKLESYDYILEVYNKCIEFENSFRQEDEGNKSEDGSIGSSDEKPMESGEEA